MVIRIAALLLALIAMVSPVQARRVALVIGQNDYLGGASATVGLRPLDNAVPDAIRMTELLAKHGFEVMSCDGKKPGCLNVNRGRFLEALNQLEQRAAGADLALVYFGGHGLASEQGNILTPIDAKVNCATGAVTQGVLVEQIMAAAQPAKDKLIILDACRDNPIGLVCPDLLGKKLSFTRIEAGAMQGLLLVTSTQFGQQALDGLAGSHSPFATALFAAFEANPGIYFEQVFNEVARSTYEAAQKQGGFLQIPGRVVGGAAPADCLAGKGCVADARMVALAIDNERLTRDAAGVRNILEREERTRGRSYTAEERQRRVAELEATLIRIGASTDPLRQKARRLIDEGNVVDGQAKLDEALDADEKALAEMARAAADRRKTAARNAQDLAVLTRGTDVLRAVAYYQRATRLDPSNAETWRDYADAALAAGNTKEAKGAFEHAALKAQESDDPRVRYWATLGLGDVAAAQGNLSSARQLYDNAVAIAEPTAKADPGNAAWQRDLSVSHNKIGDMLVEQGNLPAALERYRASLAIAERLARADPGNAGWQRDLSVSHNKIGDMLVEQGNLPGALESYQASLAIIDRLAKVDPGNAGWQRDLSVSHDRIGDVLRGQGNLPAALESYRASLIITERLAKADPGNAGWQRDLSVSQDRIGDVLRAQGNLPEALESLRASLAIRERLAKVDPGNAGWQRDLSVSHNKIGEGLVDLGNLPEALESYQASLAIRERLAKADPGNAGWQYNLGISNERIGDVLVAQGNLDAALKRYRAKNEIISRLAKADPGNAGWQRDLAISNERLGGIHARQGQRQEAIAAFERALAAYNELLRRNPGDIQSRVFSVVPLWRLGELKGKDGRRDFEAALAILKPLAAADRLDANRRGWIAQIERQLAAMEKQ
jgi:tetratricopeptide (TPR) repeat protein